MTFDPGGRRRPGTTMDGVESDRNGLEILSRSECMTLLESAAIGRIGVSIGALPVILPVNFAIVDGDIVLRTAAGTKLDEAAINLVVAFEVDGIDPVWHRPWGVLVQGVAEEVTDPADLQRFRQILAPWTDVDGHFVRIATQILSGHRPRAVGAGNGSV